MKKLLLVLALAVSGCLLAHNAFAQGGLLKKIKDKANQVADKALDKKNAEKTGLPGDQAGASTSSTSTGGSRPANKMGQGLKNSTPPDVQQQIADAEKAHTSGNYSDARYAIQQALLGVEIQLGQQILQSLPTSVSGLPKDTVQDRVTSTNWGWSNLTIQRVYQKDDKQLTVVIGNNPLYSGALDMYFSGVYTTQSAGDNQNMKQIKIKGHKAVIKFDESEGYTVLMPVGQSALITWQGINYADETEIMNTVHLFDLEPIKKMLGEK